MARVTPNEGDTITVIAKGTLVRVKDRVLTSIDGEVATQHGQLWLYMHPSMDMPRPTETLHWYRSLSTGYEHPWFDHEVEQADGE